MTPRHGPSALTAPSRRPARRSIGRANPGPVVVPEMHLVARDRHPAGNIDASGWPQLLFGAEHGVDVEQAETRNLAAPALDAAWIGDASGRASDSRRTDRASARRGGNARGYRCPSLRRAGRRDRRSSLSSPAASPVPHRAATAGPAAPGRSRHPARRVAGRDRRNWRSAARPAPRFSGADRVPLADRTAAQLRSRLPHRRRRGEGYQCGGAPAILGRQPGGFGEVRHDAERAPARCAR